MAGTEPRTLDTTGKYQKATGAPVCILSQLLLQEVKCVHLKSQPGVGENAFQGVISQPAWQSRPTHFRRQTHFDACYLAPSYDSLGAENYDWQVLCPLLPLFPARGKPLTVSVAVPGLLHTSLPGPSRIITLTYHRGKNKSENCQGGEQSTL